MHRNNLGTFTTATFEVTDDNKRQHLADTHFHPHKSKSRHFGIHDYRNFSSSLRIIHITFVSVLITRIKPTITSVEHNLYFSSTNPNHKYTLRLSTSHHRAVCKGAEI